jgi:hypothetical protein
MKRVVLISAAMLLTVAVIAAGVFVARHDWAVEELMSEIHVGPSSPYANINAQATAAAPEWEKLEGVLSPLDEMCRALLSARDATIRDSSVGYVEAVGALRTAITDRDLPAFQTSSQRLRKSCADCHFQGGVGGDLPSR